jgi:hypothetical protein
MPSVALLVRFAIASASLVKSRGRCGSVSQSMNDVSGMETDRVTSVISPPSIV